MAKAVKNTKPVIDYGKLTASNAELPKSVRGGILDGTPFVDWMKESRSQGVAKRVVVPAAAEAQTVYLIRMAAQRVNCGVRVVSAKDGANVALTFQAKDKRKSKKDGTPAPAAPVTATA